MNYTTLIKKILLFWGHLLLISLNFLLNLRLCWTGV